MKRLTMLLALFALNAAAMAQGLDRNDAGEYVLLNTKQEPTAMQMRFYQNGTQWVMDSRDGNGNWQAVCRGDGVCRLKVSSAAKMQEWRQFLPNEIKTMPMACINNIAFAFCRVSKPDNPNQRLYWWFAWRNGQTHALGLNRLR